MVGTISIECLMALCKAWLHVFSKVLLSYIFVVNDLIASSEGPLASFPQRCLIFSSTIVLENDSITEHKVVLLRIVGNPVTLGKD